ncbi:CHAT domain-containing protein [Dapis sp. BLCC M126]|uniref:CHAT domain-containing protein n=1 Tax=Dapis sp. BLCC M126 TaxID=3400189 RepID=UPI003CEFAF6D
MKTVRCGHALSLLMPLLAALAATPTKAQPITPANNTTGTTVNQNGNEFEIQGGTRSGANLFHSFDQFNLNSGQTANFLTTPDTTNILGRVTGGNASYINGLIQVIGGNSNLFLMNPAGIILGQNASLNIPASFSVTTATGIGFDNNNFWFKAIGTNDYSKLVGNPSGYKFNVSNPGAIVNEANLSLNPGENLTLLGGTVINTGELSASGGNIIIAAVEGGSTLRISQPGHLLSLDVDSSVVSGEDTNITPLSLAKLLTSGETSEATSVIVNTDGDVVLIDSNTIIADTPGDVITSGNIDVSNSGNVGGEIILQADNDITVNEKIETDSNVEIKAGRSININADIDTSEGNGNISLFGNDNNANVENRREGLASINQQEGTTLNAGSGTIAIRLGALGEIGDINLANLTTEGRIILNANSGNITQVSPNSLITAEKAILRTRGAGGIGLSDAPLRFDVNNLEALTGKGGVFIDSISSLTVGGVNGQLTGISTGGRRGRIQLNVDGDINIEEGIESAHNVRLTASESVNINADINTENGDGNIFIEGNNGEGKGDIIQAEGTNLEAGSGTIRIELGNVEEIGDITLGNLTTTGEVLVNANGGNIESVSENSLINAGSILLETSGSGGIGLSDLPLRLDVEKLEAVGGSGGVFFDVLGDVDVAGISTSDGGDIELLAENKITVSGDISTGVSEGDGGDINISSANDEIDTTEGEINASSIEGDGGNIEISAGGDINTGEITAAAGEVVSTTNSDGTTNFTANGGNGNGGNVNLMSEGEINTTGGEINTFSLNSDGGDVTINATGKIQTGKIRSASSFFLIDENDNEITVGSGIGDAGKITLESSTSDIDTTADNLLSFSFDGSGGDIEITAAGDITTGNISTVTGEVNEIFKSDGTRDTESLGGSGTGGSITLNSGGVIDTTAGNLSSISSNNIGGDVSMSAKDDIQVGEIFTSFFQSSVRGGNITLQSEGGINSPNSFLISGAAINGGDITITATDDIQLGEILSLSSGDVGTINITSDEGAISTTYISSSSFVGTGGDISILAEGNIQTGFTSSFSLGEESGGDITIRSRSGSIDTSANDVTTGNSFIPSRGGDISISADGDIITATVSTSGASEAGNITLESSNGNIDTTNGIIFANAEEGNGGNISITALGNISIADTSSSSDNGNGGNITIISSDGSVFTTGGDIFSFSQETGKGGNIEVIADGNINSKALIADGVTEGGDINLTSVNGSVVNSSSLSSSSENGIGGDITVNSEGLIILSGLLISTGNTQAGNINLTSNSSDVDTSGAFVSITSENGTDGNLNITANAGSIEIGEISGSRNIAIEDGGEDDGFSNNPDANITSDADQVNQKSGEVSLQAHNDITINEPIESEDISNLELRAGRNINLNADIDTSNSNGNITLRANDQGADLQYRDEGSGNITMAADTTINAGSGDISISIGKLAEIGDITLSNLLTTGNVAVDANGGNIFRSSENSLITSANAVFQTEATGSIGVVTEPLNLSVENLEARSGSGGAFFNSPTQGINIGNASNTLIGISNLDGGEIEVTAQGDITVTESLFTGFVDAKAGDITLNSIEGGIDTTNATLNSSSTQGEGGSISLTAMGNINAANLSSFSLLGDAGAINITSINGFIDTTSGVITSDSSSGNAATVNLSAFGDINTAKIDSFSVQGDGGKITMNSSSGSIHTNGVLNSTSDLGNGGDIVLNAEGDIEISKIETLSGSGNGGNIEINSNTGIINTNGNVLWTFSIIDGEQGNGGNVSLSADGDIYTGLILTGTNGTGVGGDISITSRNGSIDTTVDTTDLGISSEADVTSEEVTTVFSEGNSINNPNLLNNPNLHSYSIEGTGGDITLTAKGNITTHEISSFGGNTSGNVNISSTEGNINTNVIFSTGENELGGNVFIQTNNEGNININHIATYSTNGTGGEIILDSGGNVTINNIASFGPQESGDVRISSNINEIQTRNITTQADGGPSGDIVVNGTDVATGNVSSLGSVSAGVIQIEATDGSIRTENIESSSEQGTAGGIDLDASDDIDTGSQTVDAGEGDANIDNTAGDDISATEQNSNADEGDANIDVDAGGDVDIDEQTSTTNEGDANIDVDAGGDVDINEQTSTTNEGDANIDVDAMSNIFVGDQTTTTEDGNATIENNAGDNLTTEDQTTTTENGDATIDNNAGNNITTEDQTATTENGDATIDNNAGNNITTGDQTAITNVGDATIDNNAGNNITTGDQTAITNVGDATIDNNAGNNITTGDQTAITNVGDATIDNNAGNNITTGDQTAITNVGDATIDNNAGNNITTGDQTAITNDGISTIENNAPGTITIGDQTQIGNNILPDNNPVNNTPNNSTSPEITNSIPAVNNNNPQIITSNPATLIAPNNPSTNNPSPIDNNLNQTITNNPVSTIINSGNNTSVIQQQGDNFSTIIPTNTPPTPNNSRNNISEKMVNNSEIISEMNAQLNNPNNPTQDNSELPGIPITNTNQIQQFLTNTNPLTIATNEVSGIISLLEKNRVDEFSNYFGENLDHKLISTKGVRELLSKMHSQTGKKPGVIYFTAYQEQLQLVLFTETGEPILKTISGVGRKKIRDIAMIFSGEITDLRNRNTTSYLPFAQKLYNWLIAPISEELEATNIDTLLFSMDSGLRLLPLAALHDGQQFLIEKYSISLIPSVSLMDSRYNSVHNTTLLGMGASQFNDQPPLPAVPIELQTISHKLWQGNMFLNEEFTRNNLINQMQKRLYPIVHLATHAEFKPGNASDSHIHLWDDKLGLDEIRKLRWNSEVAELLVLSACRTAVGDRNAELGFAGLAIATGVKSAMGSFWFVNDEATLGLMTEFYSHLGNVKIKAEALREAQVAMLRGEVMIEDGMLRGLGSRGEVALPPELADIKDKKFSHPYYWAGFTMVGSPW